VGKSRQTKKSQKGDEMIIQTVVISTKELQDALRIYCSDKVGIPDIVIIQSYENQIVVNLCQGGMVTADEFNHGATG
jgi:hypothetical protein